MEERAGYAGGDGDQVALAGEHFDLPGAGEFGEIDGAPTADAGDRKLVSHDAGHVGQQLTGVDE